MYDENTSQRAILGELIQHHPRMLTRADLRRLLPGVDIDQHLAVLSEDGLARVLGDLIGATRAAVRGDQLRL